MGANRADSLPSSYPEAHASGFTRRPSWQAKPRELWIGKILVKQFRRPAPVLELILAAFEEEGWPSHLDDPIPPTPEVDSITRLHDSINRLNRMQETQLVVFSGDGTGRGIRW